MESVVADLTVVLTTRTEPAIAGFAQTGAAGEEMAAKLAASTERISVEMAKMTEAIGKVGLTTGETAAKVTASSTTMSEGYTAAGASVDQFGNVSVTTAEKATAANDKILASMAKMVEASKVSTAQFEVDYRAMAAATEASAAKMAAASEASAAKMEASFAKVDASAEATVAANNKRAKSMGMAAVATVAVGAVAVDMAAKYETSSTKLVTSAGESTQAIESVRQGMLEMAGQVGVSATNLSDAMYKVESAGYHAGAGLGLLKAAEQGAKAEGADGVKVADALSSAMRDYYPHAQSAADVTKYSTDVMSKFIGATSAGKMTFDDLAGSLNSILPVSSAANISLSDTLGVLASMTVHGISADQATQNMADAVRHLQVAAQSTVQSKALATLGLDANDISQKLGERGLSGTMQLISDRIKNFMPPGSDKVILDLGTALNGTSQRVQDLADKLMNGSISSKEYSKEAKALTPIEAEQAQKFAALAGSYHQLGTAQMSGQDVMATYSGLMQKAMGDATGLKVALMTTGENAQYTSDSIKTISGSTADASGNVKGFAEVQQTFNQKLAEAKASLGAVAIQLGNVLLPVLKPVIDAVAVFAGWLGKHPAIAQALAIALGVMAVAFTIAAVAIWAMNSALFANPITWIILAVVALIAGVILLAMHWRQVWDAIKTVVGAVWSWIKSNVFDPIVRYFHALGDALSSLKTSVWDPMWDGISTAVKFAWNNVIRPILELSMIPAFALVKGAIWFFKESWEIAWDAISFAAKWVWDNVIHPVFTWIDNNAIKPLQKAIKWLGDEWDYWTKVIGLGAQIMYDQYIAPVFRWINDNAIKPVADTITWFGGVWDSIWGGIVKGINWAWGIIKDVASAISGAFKGVMDIVGKIGGAINSVAGAVGIHIPGFADGGWVPGQPGEARLAVVHGGEYVLSQDMQTGNAPVDPKIGPALAGSGGGGVSAGVRSPGGVQVTQVSVIVQGTVLAERQLIDVVRDGLLRDGTYRPATYQPYRR